MTDNVPGFVDRSHLQKTLSDFTSGAMGLPELKAWIKKMVVGDQVEFYEPESKFLLRVIQSLDSVLHSDSALRSIATELEKMLRCVESIRMAEALVPVVEGRTHILGVVEKYLAGVLSRTSFLSFLTERQWSMGMKRKLEQLSHSELQYLYDSLSARDYGRLSVLLSY